MLTLGHVFLGFFFEIQSSVAITWKFGTSGSYPGFTGTGCRLTSISRIRISMRTIPRILCLWHWSLNRACIWRCLVGLCSVYLASYICALCCKKKATHCRLNVLSLKNVERSVKARMTFVCPSKQWVVSSQK